MANEPKPVGRIVSGQSVRERMVWLAGVDAGLDLALLVGQRVAFASPMSGPACRRVGSAHVLDVYQEGARQGLWLSGHLSAACPAACAGDDVYLADDVETWQQAGQAEREAAEMARAVERTRPKASEGALAKVAEAQAEVDRRAKAMAKVDPNDDFGWRVVVQGGKVGVWTPERVLEALKAAPVDDDAVMSSRVAAAGLGRGVGMAAWNRSLRLGEPYYRFGNSPVGGDLVWYSELEAMADALNRAAEPLPGVTRTARPDLLAGLPVEGALGAPRIVGVDLASTRDATARTVVKDGKVVATFVGPCTCGCGELLVKIDALDVIAKATAPKPEAKVDPTCQCDPIGPLKAHRDGYGVYCGSCGLDVGTPPDDPPIVPPGFEHATKVDPYVRARIKRLDNASASALSRHMQPSASAEDAMARAKACLYEARQALDDLHNNVAELEAAIAECGETGAK